jgi:hypothetical protein
MLQRRRHLLQGSAHIRAYAIRIDWRLRFCAQCETLAPIIDTQTERVIGRLFGAESLDPFPRPECLSGSIGRRVVRLTMSIVEECAKERRRRRNCAASLRQRQRRVLMPQQLCQQRMSLPHALLHTLPADPDPHRQCVDEDARRPIGAFAALHAPEQYRAKYNVISPGHSTQYQRTRQVAQTRRAHPQGSRHPP